MPCILEQQSGPPTCPFERCTAIFSAEEQTSELSYKGCRRPSHALELQCTAARALALQSRDSSTLGRLLVFAHIQKCSLYSCFHFAHASTLLMISLCS